MRLQQFTAYWFIVEIPSDSKKEGGRGKGMKGISLRLANTFRVPDLQSGSKYYGDDDTGGTLSCRGKPPDEKRMAFVQ
jgi:hypothetical protein